MNAAALGRAIQEFLEAQELCRRLEWAYAGCRPEQRDELRAAWNEAERELQAWARVVAGLQPGRGLDFARSTQALLLWPPPATRPASK